MDEILPRRRTKGSPNLRSGERKLVLILVQQQIEPFRCKNQQIGSFACAKIRNFWPANRVLAQNGFALRRSEALSARTGSADLGFSRTRAPSRVEKGRVACQSAVSWPKIGNNSARAARDVRCRCLGKRYAHRGDESAVSNVHRGSSSIAWPLRLLGCPLQ